VGYAYDTVQTYKSEAMLQRTQASFSEYKVTHFIQKINLLWRLGGKNRLGAREQGLISEKLRPSADTRWQQKGSWRAEAWNEETLLLLEALSLLWKWQKYIFKKCYVPTKLNCTQPPCSANNRSWTWVWRTFQFHV
jgi:hypothetical protein